MHSSPEALSANIDMYDHALRLACQASEAISHRKGNHFIRTRDDLGEGIRLAFLAFHDGFEKRRVISTEVDKAIRDSKLLIEEEKSIMRLLSSRKGNG